jgi:flavin-dependent dehydrogenase
MEEINIIGAGPAGSAAAFFAGQEGYEVRVYDSAPWLGFKACGWAVPIQIEKLVKIPREFILAKIKRFSVYLNDELIHDKALGMWGYIIDKPKFLEYLLSYANTIRKHVRITLHDKNGKLQPIVLDNNMEKGTTILAIGATLNHLRKQYNGMGDVIYAVQYVTKVKESPIDQDSVELRFYGDMIGYQWVFPRGENIIDIGVGGYASPQDYLRMLYDAVKRITGTKPETTRIRGAWINISGVDLDLVTSSPPVIGEAAGFVYPITGEGIRPSIASAKAIIEHIKGNKKWQDHIRHTIKWIKIQRILLNRALKASRRTREDLLKKLPLEYFVGIGIGELTIRQTMGLLRYLPSTVVSAIKNILLS